MLWTKTYQKLLHKHHKLKDKAYNTAEKERELEEKMCMEMLSCLDINKFPERIYQAKHNFKDKIWTRYGDMASYTPEEVQIIYVSTDGRYEAFTFIYSQEDDEWEIWTKSEGERYYSIRSKENSKPSYSSISLDGVEYCVWSVMYGDH